MIINMKQIHLLIKITIKTGEKYRHCGNWKRIICLQFWEHLGGYLKVTFRRYWTPQYFFTFCVFIPIHDSLFFATLKNRFIKDFFKTDVIFWVKNWKFFTQKNNVGLIDFLFAHLFFRRKKQCVVRLVNLLGTHTF